MYNSNNNIRVDAIKNGQWEYWSILPAVFSVAHLIQYVVNREYSQTLWYCLCFSFIFSYAIIKKNSLWIQFGIITSINAFVFWTVHLLTAHVTSVTSILLHVCNLIIALSLSTTFRTSMRAVFYSYAGAVMMQIVSLVIRSGVLSVGFDFGSPVNLIHDTRYPIFSSNQFVFIYYLGVHLRYWLVLGVSLVLSRAIYNRRQKKILNSINVKESKKIMA